MLSLTDAAFARICIGATGIDPRRRRQWLRDLAQRLDPPRKTRSPSPDARRQAKTRQRRKNGLRSYRFDLSDRAVEGLILKFILEGKLTEAEALDHRNVEKAIAAFVEEEGFCHA
jgi:hypothetical protein